MVSGSAALLLDAYPHRTVGEIKSLLMNTAETKIYNNLANTPGYLAPITRIGGGEVRVDRALKSPAAAWDRYAHSGDLSFGFVDATQAGDHASPAGSGSRTTRTGRFATRSARGSATRTTGPTERSRSRPRAGSPSRRTPSGRSRSRSRSTAAKLRERGRSTRARAALDARALDLLEYDGYLTFNNLADPPGRQEAAPRRLAGPAAAVGQRQSPASTSLVADGTISGGDFDGLPGGDHHPDQHRRRDSHDRPVLAGRHEPGLPPAVRGSNQPVIDIKARRGPDLPGPGEHVLRARPTRSSTSSRSATGSARRSARTRVRSPRSSTRPATVSADFVVFNAPISGPATTGDVRTLTWVEDLVTGDATAYFYADHGDERLEHGPAVLRRPDRAGRDRVRSSR